MFRIVSFRINKAVQNFTFHIQRERERVTLLLCSHIGMYHKTGVWTSSMGEEQNLVKVVINNESKRYFHIILYKTTEFKIYLIVY